MLKWKYVLTILSAIPVESEALSGRRRGNRA